MSTETPPIETLEQALAGSHLNSRDPMSDQIFAILREAIVRVRLRPGQSLSEKETAELLGASKTPVREAFIRLAGAGLVEIVPKSGTYVTPISIRRFLEARFIRIELETGAARRAAGRHEDLSAIVRIETNLRQQEAAVAAGDFEEFFLADDAFHRLVFDMAGLTGVWHFMRQSQADIDRLRHLKRRYGIRNTAKVLADHKAIAAALRAGSGDRAEAAMLAHLGSLEGDIDDLSAHPELLTFVEKLNGRDDRARRSA